MLIVILKCHQAVISSCRVPGCIWSTTLIIELFHFLSKIRNILCEYYTRVILGYVTSLLYQCLEKKVLILFLRYNLVWTQNKGKLRDDIQPVLQQYNKVQLVWPCLVWIKWPPQYIFYLHLGIRFIDETGRFF